MPLRTGSARTAPDEFTNRGSVATIRARPAAVRVGVLARDLGISRDRLEKRFRCAVGCSPKQLASILRLHAAVGTYAPGVNLTQLALGAGYADQAHFNREFRAVTGDSPRRFLGASAYC